MNLFEKLNRLDDSLVESKRVVKKKKLTESVEDDFDYSDFIPEEMTQFFCINEEDNEDPDEYMPEKGYRGYRAVASLIACGDYAEELRDCGYQYALLINDPADKFFVGYIAGDRIYKLTEEDIYDQLGLNYDDDIDEMLTEAMPKQRPARSLGYSYGIADIKDYAKRLLANTNIHEQNKMIEELVGGARITSAQVDDLVERLTTYSQALHKYIDSSRTDSDVQTLLDEIKDLSI